MDSGLSVLIVDDSADQRLLLRLVLERHGATVVAEADNGQGGIEAAAKHQPDLVLLDLAMPMMSGVEALPRLSAAAPDARVVVLSQFPASRVAAPTAALGAAGFVQKGTPVEHLFNEILLAAGFVDAISRAIQEAATSFSPDPHSARDARHFVDQTLRHWDCQALLDTVALLVSELVSNVVQHAHTDLDVAVRLLRDRVRVEVSDRTTTPLQPRVAGLYDTSGRGLLLVDKMSQAWGVDETSGGKTVWFEVERPAERSAS